MPSPFVSSILAVLLAAAAPPEVREHFPEAGTPGHAFLVVDMATGEVLRLEDPDTCYGQGIPLGGGHRWLRALAALEAGLDPGLTVVCDSTCWAQGDHGEVGLVNALAWGCERYARSLPEDERDLDEVAARLGLDEDAVELAAWTEFWRRVERADLGWRSSTQVRFVAASTTTVSSPRGSNRALHHPHRRTRAIGGETADGAWVTGTMRLAGGRHWAFALFLRHGTGRLATTRCAHLLEETVRTARASSRVRGGQPWGIAP